MPPLHPVGQHALRAKLALKVPEPHVRSYVGASERHTIETPEWTEELYRRHGALADSVVEHLRFALKHEPLDLGVLTATFRSMDPSDLEAWVRSEPTGEFARRAWFLYERFTGRSLDLPDMAGAKVYALAMDPDLQLTVPDGERSKRHKVIDNLPGVPGFCPTVRRTRKLDAMRAAGLPAEAQSLLTAASPDVLARAVSYLYTKETMSSFAIEGETAQGSRAERFVAALRHAEAVDPTREADLVRLQNLIVDPRFAVGGFRTHQIFVGETLGNYREHVHFVCPRPGDVPDLMRAWAQTFARSQRGLDPVVAAAVAAFGFVFIHPFDDGNGRIHRFLIHHVLARAGFTPRGALFPVSAAIVRDMRSYDRVLEAFSGAIMPFIDWRADERGEVHVLNETAHLYRYFDATRHAEFLYDKVAETIRKDLREELDFVTVYDAAVRAVRERVDMPDRRVSLFVRFCLQNEGRLSKNKRKDFPELSDAELDELEALVAQARALRALPVDDADATTRSPPR